MPDETNVAFQKGKIAVLHEAALAVVKTIPESSAGYKEAKKELEQIRFICNRASQALEKN